MAGDDGAWTLEIEMQPGIHEVTYVIDGEVVLPPGAGTTVGDGFGGLNAVVVVP